MHRPTKTQWTLTASTKSKKIQNLQNFENLLPDEQPPEGTEGKNKSSRVKNTPRWEVVGSCGYIQMHQYTKGFSYERSKTGEPTPQDRKNTNNFWKITRSNAILLQVMANVTLKLEKVEK